MSANAFLLLLIEPPGARIIHLGLFDFNPEVKLGDLLTPLTVLVTVLTFVWTVRKDMRSRKSAEADKVRGAAAKALGKLERWKELALWYYRDIQPSFVETSDVLLKEFDVEKARDFLWTALSSARIKSAERLLNESLETAYVELSSYFPGIYEAFSQTVSRMKALDESAYGELLRIGQNTVLNYRKRQEGYAPPLLGNDLRQCAGLASTFLGEELGNAWTPVRMFLIETIKRTDNDVLKSKQNGALVPGPPPQKHLELNEFLHAHTRAASVS